MSKQDAVRQPYRCPTQADFFLLVGLFFLLPGPGASVYVLCMLPLLLLFAIILPRGHHHEEGNITIQQDSPVHVSFLSAFPFLPSFWLLAIGHHIVRLKSQGIFFQILEMI